MFILSFPLSLDSSFPQKKKKTKKQKNPQKLSSKLTDFGQCFRKNYQIVESYDHLGFFHIHFFKKILIIKYLFQKFFSSNTEDCKNWYNRKASGFCSNITNTHTHKLHEHTHSRHKCNSCQLNRDKKQGHFPHKRNCHVIMVTLLQRRCTMPCAWVVTQLLPTQFYLHINSNNTKKQI